MKDGRLTIEAKVARVHNGNGVMLLGKVVEAGESTTDVGDAEYATVHSVEYFRLCVRAIQLRERGGGRSGRGRCQRH